jgi:hypothetical protein
MRNIKIPTSITIMTENKQMQELVQITFSTTPMMIIEQFQRQGNIG